MKWLSAAIVVVAIVAADFGATYYHFSAKQQHGWATADTIGLVFFVWLFVMAHREGEK